MRTRIPSLLSLSGLLLALTAVVAVSLLVIGSPVMAAPLDAPAAQATLAGVPVTTLPASTCPVTTTLVGVTRTCELWTMTGTITMPTGLEVPVWGFADNPAGPAQVPGPVMIGNEGETLEVVLHNQLAVTVSLAFPGQTDPTLIPDLVGVATGDVVTYTMALTPGTYLYEAGLTPNGSRQVAMGLHGALVVRPITATRAYTPSYTHFDDEAVLVLSEIDPGFNANPLAFTMYEFAPRFWLINGKAYPETAVIDTHAGNTILLRYVNAGMKSHWLGALGLEQRIIGSDGALRKLPLQVVAQTVASGQTIDALVVVPSSAVSETQFAVYDTNMLLHNAGYRPTDSGPVDFGGMMTFIRTVSGTAQYEDGPVATVGVVPTNTTGEGGIVLTVRVDDSTNGNDEVTLIEYFTDTVGAVGTGISQTVGGSSVATATWNIDAAELANLSSGSHIFYARGKDVLNNWGFVGSAVLNLDKTGPMVHGMSLAPDPTNGERDVLLRATGDDHGTGANNVISGTYSLGGGPAMTMSLDITPTSAIKAMTATLPAAVLTATPEGLIPIAIMAEDALGNWGTPSVTYLTLDKTGPDTISVTLVPNSVVFSPAPDVINVRLTAVFTEPLSNGVRATLANAEAFVGTPGPGGTGFDLIPSDGLFDEAGETAYFDIPVSSFAALASGEHTVHVHGLDKAGNWGPLGLAIITVQHAAGDGPAISDLQLSPNPTGGAAQATLTALASYTATVDAAQYWVDAGPWMPMDAADGAFDSDNEALTALVDVSTMQNGEHAVWVRARSASIWGLAATTTIRVSGNSPIVVMANSFENGFAGWTGGTVGQVDTGPQAALAPDGGTMGMMAALGTAATASVDAVSPAYASHIVPAGETSYRMTFYWDPNGTDFGDSHPDIMLGLDKAMPIFGIRAEMSGSGDGYELKAWVLVDGVVQSTDWYDVSDAPHKLHLEWKNSVGRSLLLSIDDVLAGQVLSKSTQDQMLYEAHLGPSGDLDPAASGVQYFDGFTALRMVRVWLPVVWR